MTKPDPTAVYAALAAVAAILAAVIVAILLVLDTRAGQLQRDRGTDEHTNAWTAATAQAGRLRWVAQVVVVATLVVGGASLAPWGKVAFCDLDGGWEFWMPWAATVVAFVVLAGWAQITAGTLRTIAKGE
jgi:ABC-type uncharacterized transport system permease subunit